MKIARMLYMLSGRFKGILFVLTVAVIVALVAYTRVLVKDIRKDSRAVVEFYAKMVQHLISSEDSAPVELNSFFDIIRQTNFPLIQVSKDGTPTAWKGISVPEWDRSPDAISHVKRIMNSMGKENEPIVLEWRDPQSGKNWEMGYLYYGDSKLIPQLMYLPYVEIITIGLLILIAYLGYSSIKRSEQRFIWVGMAKETAHQLGTPISSMMGWLEVIRSEKSLRKVKETLNDIEMDIKRLEKVAARFSQIGSEAALKEQDIAPSLHEVVKYFHRRLPQSGKAVRIIENYSQLPDVAINRDLFEWVVENLIKNSLDAIKKRSGVVEISTGIMSENGRVYVDVKDNGRGIGLKNRSDIFKPGYSTKKRGWGLGLNLAKRIIEEYHSGKLILKETKPGEGTTMRIIL